MLRTILTAGAAVLGCGLLGAVPAGADPAPAPPPIPNVFANTPVNPADYTVNGGKWFAFAGPAGVVCILDSLKGNYGCAGPLPGAPGGANLVSAGPVGAPVFATTESPAYADAGAVHRVIGNRWRERWRSRRWTPAFPNKRLFHQRTGHPMSVRFEKLGEPVG